jgi:hypothetical protein
VVKTADIEKLAPADSGDAEVENEDSEPSAVVQGTPVQLSVFKERYRL